MKDHMYNSIYMHFPDWANPTEGKLIDGCLGWVEKRSNC
jgi:hypothetical protein